MSWTTRMPSFALLAPLLALAACSDGNLVDLGGGPPPTQAQALIEVTSDHPTDPHVVDFGQVYAGEVREKEVTIRNVGADTLQVQDLFLPEVGNFSVVNDDYDRLLAPDRSTVVVLSYSPVRDEHISGTMLVASNDRDHAQVALSLLAEGLAPAIQLDPPSYDFGNRELGCVGQVVVTVANVGRAPLVVEDLWYEDFSGHGELQAVHDLQPGETLDPDESRVVTIHYVPEDVEFDSGVLHVVSNDPSTPEATAQQFGLASYGENALDAYLQEGNNATDVLFVIDNSGSMGDEQSALAVNFASYSQVIEALDMDYHLGVVSMDVGGAGRLEGTVPIITPDTPDPAGTFSTNVNLGTGGSGIEQGFHTAYLALSSPNIDPGGYNYGFLRPDAGLRIIFVSDEPEQSSSVMGWSATDYVEFFRSLKPNPDHVVLSDITGGMSGCSTADAGVDYVLGSNLTGGISAIVCDPNWVQTLSQLAWLSQSFADTFELSRTPVPETVAVSLNGVPVYVGWVYDSALNAVIFDLDHVPENGDAIDIEYTVQGDCQD